MPTLSITRPLIQTAELQAALKGAPPAAAPRQAPVLVDCRFALDDPQAGIRAWQQSRLPGARYGHLEQDFSGPVQPGRSGRHPLPDAAALIERLRSWGVGPDTPVVFYDASGGPFAARGWWLACHLGHPAAAVLDGGLDAWLAAGGELETGPPALPTEPAPVWPQRPPLLEAASVADVTAALGSATPLLDARSPERFAGVQEPIDPVAGHIPGARCMPHAGNLDGQGRFLPASDLAARWRGQDANAAICYCGSGVTAAHNVLAAVAAGLGRPRLYVGSWSEWITDPSRPVARGPS
ncbi:MAG: sulfurtransferase [Gammaproteobacteria bacterium]|nr:sulfurtransferase [Gammaproteobacteria bacterium]